MTAMDEPDEWTRQSRQARALITAMATSTNPLEDQLIIDLTEEVRQEHDPTHFTQVMMAMVIECARLSNDLLASSGLRVDIFSMFFQVLILEGRGNRLMVLQAHDVLKLYDAPHQEHGRELGEAIFKLTAAWGAHAWLCFGYICLRLGVELEEQRPEYTLTRFLESVAVAEEIRSERER
jgi:hypothetical protein